MRDTLSLNNAREQERRCPRRAPFAFLSERVERVAIPRVFAAAQSERVWDNKSFHGSYEWANMRAKAFEIRRRRLERKQPR